jgi:ATP-dependent DNA helicase RecG
MMNTSGRDILKTPIEYLKGVGPQRGETLKKELQIFTFEDLLTHYPFRYVDRTKYHTVAELHPESDEVQIRGKITGIREEGKPRQKRLIASFEDETGRIDLVWFKGARWTKQSLPVGENVVIYGKPKAFGMKMNIPHPEVERLSEHKAGVKSNLTPVYSSGEKLSAKGLNSKGIEKLMVNLLTELQHSLPEYLPNALIKRLKFPDRKTALQNIHFPPNQDALQNARNRLKFDEFLLLQMAMIKQKKVRESRFRAIPFEKVGDHFNGFYSDHLPFDLTGAQKRVLKEIRGDLKRPQQMNRLLQGDVGSGKTVVGLMTMLLAADNGCQSCLMAPTEILATQHFNGISELVEKMDIRVELLTGSTKKAERKRIHEGLLDGSIDILIGTHTLIEDTVQFKNLGLAVIDEQHRFGVAQRGKLWKKNTLPPHVLVMTATPIPRTLSMTFYGDLDVSVIDELPPGRKPIDTQHRFENSRLAVFGFLKKEIATGRQVYIVFPLIEESETLDYKNLMEGYEAITKEFPRPDYQVSIVHGQMKADDKEAEMNRFASGKTQIMVATTVIEVGVNVPNASVMVIESAERFGLSQLHQLRGRVGRGAEQSYCILMTGHKLSNEARTRMQTMCETNDGFRISEVDLQLRGPGDIMGTQQSGLVGLKIGSLTQDGQWIILAREAAKWLLEKDPELNDPKHAELRKIFLHKHKDKFHWSRIS